MRITGGTARNRKLIPPRPGNRDHVRPTSDRVREALFNILGKKVEGARVLDLFSGTGSLGLDALSRGAASAVFVDQFPQSLELVRKNVHLCFSEAEVAVVRRNLDKKNSYQFLYNTFAAANPFTLIFLDPPYQKKLAEKALTMVEETGLLAADGFVVAEERSKITLPDTIGLLALQTQRSYGETGIWIYRLTY